METNTVNVLMESAFEAAKNSYSPYSNFRVGAAVLCESGKIIKGTNIENSSFGLTCCAERVALFSAVSSGEKPKDIAVVCLDDLENLSSPCGSCRQVISELLSDNGKIFCSYKNTIVTFDIDDLLPERFKLN